MDYIVVDSGFKSGKERNILFAPNEKDEAIEYTDEIGPGLVVMLREIKLVVYVSPHKADVGFCK